MRKFWSHIHECLRIDIRSLANDRSAYLCRRHSFDRTYDFRLGGIIIRVVQRDAAAWSSSCQKNGFALGRESREQLLKKVSRVADHPSISSPFGFPYATLIFVSFHSTLSSLAPSLGELKEAWVRTCLEKFQEGSSLAWLENGHQACNATYSPGNFRSKNPLLYFDSYYFIISLVILLKDIYMG